MRTIYNTARTTYYKLHRLAHPHARLLKHMLQNLLRNSSTDLVYCIGDSHNQVFNHILHSDMMPDTELRVITVQGATVFGLANPNSKTNALKQFSREIRHVPHDACITVLLGEVDCGFLIWYRAEKERNTIEDQMKISLGRYEDFLMGIIKSNTGNIGVFSVPPPTIRDGDQSGKVANQRSSVTASMSDRIALTDSYNSKLKTLTEKLNIRYIDTSPSLIDENTGKVRRELLSSNPADHHLDSMKAARIYSDALRAFLKSPHP